MITNEQLILRFYQAFQHKDYQSMQDCYADEATFSDEVFKNLSAQEVRSMWEMLLKRGQDLVIDFENIHADDQKGSAEWKATYTFSKTKRKVINRIKAEFRFENGKIVQHTDRFSFHKWASQALGATGLLLGWTGFLRRKVQQNAMESLRVYMRQKGNIL